MLDHRSRSGKARDPRPPWGLRAPCQLLEPPPPRSSINGYKKRGLRQSAQVVFGRGSKSTSTPGCWAAGPSHHLLPRPGIRCLRSITL